MQIFITGGGGHIGSAVVAELTQAGHNVTALVRSDSSAATAAQAGANVIRGDVEDPAALSAAVAGAEAVIHLAFDNASVMTGGLGPAAERDMAVVKAFGDALAGSDAIFIGVGIGPSGDETLDAAVSQNPRALVGREILAFAERGIRPYLIAIPPVTHSDQDVAGFVPILIRTARSTGVSGYIDEGANLWPTVHTLDLAHLLRLAVEQAPEGTQLYSAAEAVSTREIAETIARHLGIESASFTQAQAPDQFGGFAPIMSLPFPRMASDSTQAALGWTPTHATLLEDLDAGHYFERVSE